MEKNNINQISREFLASLMSFSDRDARRRTRNQIIDQYHNKLSHNYNPVPINIEIKVIKTTFKEPLYYHLLIDVLQSNTVPQQSDSKQYSFETFWDEDLSFKFLKENILVKERGINIEIKVINEKIPSLFCDTLRTCSSTNVLIKSEDIKSKGLEACSFYFEKDLMNFEETQQLGSIQFQVNLSPIDHFGVKYWKRLPVFDPDVKIPNYIMPSPSFVFHDEFNEIIVAFVIIYWLARGEKHAWDMIPPNVQTRETDHKNSDQFFVQRRLSGCNRPYNHFEKVLNKPWTHELPLSFGDYEIKPDVWLPRRTNLRFSLDQETNVLKIVGATYQMELDQPLVTIYSDELSDADRSRLQSFDQSLDSNLLSSISTLGWKEFKDRYMMIEFNYNITWAHVGVHFIVESYGMAFYRNIVNNPIRELLWPHLDGVVFNNWLVVRPMPKGVVTMAAALTYEGQVQMLEEKFRHLSYRWTPRPEDEISKVQDNTYDRADNAIWNALKEYVEEFFVTHQDKILFHWKEIELVSDDLVSHSLNKDASANNIGSIDDLCHLATYLIYQAVFRHAWIHWKAWDDEATAVVFNRNGSTSLKDILYYENLGNAIEAGVQYPSPYVRHYPILDHEFPGPPSLQQKLWQVSNEINPGISISSLVMSPNI